MRAAWFALAFAVVIAGLLLNREIKVCVGEGQCVTMPGGNEPLLVSLGVLRTQTINVSRDQDPPPTIHGDLDCPNGCKNRIGMAFSAAGPITKATLGACEGACSHVYPCPDGGKCHQDVLYDLTDEGNGQKRCGETYPQSHCRLWVLANNYGDHFIHPVTVTYVDLARETWLWRVGATISGTFVVLGVAAVAMHRKRPRKKQGR